MKKMTREQLEAWDAHVDETLATLRELIRPEWEELQRRRREGLPIGRARWLAETLSARR